MTAPLDHFNPEQKRVYVVVGVTMGLVLAVSSTALRLWAKLISTKRLQAEDGFMVAALFCGIGTASCLYYGLSTGLGQHEEDLTKPQLRHFLISLWITQRLQPLSLFFVKTSIIMFYVRIFPTRGIRIAGWAIWIYTLLWAVSISFATLFECKPVQYFWDKTIEGGRCIANPLITIGLTSGVLSCVGDIFIFGMPIPVVLRLNMNIRKKIALGAIFMVGLFVIITSFVRWIALLSTKSDLTSNQVEAGTWTFLEISIGITCGNLPLLLPLVRSWFSTGDSSRGYRNGNSGRKQGSDGFTPVETIGHRSTGRKQNTYRGFTELQDSPTGSEVELRGRNPGVLDSEAQRVGEITEGMPGEAHQVHDHGEPHGRIAKPDASIFVQTSVDVNSEYAYNGMGNRSPQQESYAPGLTTGQHTVTASAH